jgi:hypothetical protein
MNGARCVAAVLSGATLLGGCMGGDPPPACEQLTSTLAFTDANGVEKSSFGPDESIRFQIVLRNNGILPVEVLHIDGNCSAINAEARNADGEVVWQNPCYPPFALCDCAISSFTLQWGQSVSVPYVPGLALTPHEWDQRLDNGELASAGTYTGYAVDTTQCAPLLENAGEFTLVR